MTAQGKIIGGRTYRYFEVYVSLAIIYWVITFVIEQGIRLIEKKMQIPDQVAKVEISEDERGIKMLEIKTFPKVFMRIKY